jgi:poly(A) polymerase
MYRRSLPPAREAVLLYALGLIKQRTITLEQRIGRVQLTTTPLVIPRAEHNISRAFISDSALKVLYRLRDAGFASLLVGGCVRDLMLGREPKDFDVVTDARPEQIRELFRNARLIGRRFRLAHVRFGQDIIEVATFRAAPHIGEEGGEGDDDRDETGRLLSDNVFGSQAEDAVRRDFSVNALYYDISDFSVKDYVGGVADLKAGVMRTIGDPETRFREDPVRMLRVVRFAAKLGFKLDPATAEPIPELGHLLLNVSSARMFEEVLKLFHGGYALETYEMLRHYGLFRYLFPLTEDSLAGEDEHYPRLLLPRALANTDQRIEEDKPVNPAFLFSAILWEPVRLVMERKIAQGQHPYEALQQAGEEVLRDELRHVSIPKRFSFPMREIWALQPRLARRQGKHAFRMLEHKRFRAAYDFLLLRAHAGEVPQELADWWTGFQEVDEAGRAAMVQSLAPEGGEGKKRKSRRRRRKPKAGGAPAA